MIDAEKRKILEDLVNSESLKDVFILQSENSIKRHKVLTIVRNAIDALQELLPLLVKKPFITLIITIIINKLKKTLKELEDD